MKSHPIFSPYNCCIVIGNSWVQRKNKIKMKINQGERFHSIIELFISTSDDYGVRWHNWFLGMCINQNSIWLIGEYLFFLFIYIQCLMKGDQINTSRIGFLFVCLLSGVSYKKYYWKTMVLFCGLDYTSILIYLFKCKFYCDWF